MNNAIKKFIDEDFKSFKVTAEREFAEYNFSNPFYYEISSEIFNDVDLTSVLLKISTYSGGAHGNYELKSFNFDSSMQKFVDITEATAMELRELSSYSRKKLRLMDFDEMVDDGTEPNLSNFNTFTVSNGTVTIHFEPYQVAPYAAGIVTVELPRKY